MNVAIDSNALTYLAEAMEPGFDPNSDLPSLAKERIAMIRTYLYAGQPFYVLPEVESEYKMISNKDWRDTHEELVGVLLFEVDWQLDNKKVNARKKLFLKSHPKDSDCQALAEAEVAKMDIFLTRDDTFINRLSGQTEVRMLHPSAFWEEYNFSPKSKPKISPRPTNPLSYESWWKI